MNNVLKGFFIIFLFLAIGESLRYLLQLPIPGNVIGMMLIFVALEMRLISLKSVDKTAGALLSHLALFFVPPGVGLMLYFDLLEKYWVAIVAASGLSTLLVMGITGLIYQKTAKKNVDA